MLRIFTMYISCALVTLLSAPVSGDPPRMIVIRPQPYRHALRNPLKGFRPDTCDGRHEYATLARVYLKWNELERNASDGEERIRKICDEKWRGAEKHNVKIIPRVYLHWSGSLKYWPSDMRTGDYSSSQFKSRVKRFVAKLGRCWDNDPRVAWVQMGIIGKWGEQHYPPVSPEMQKLLGDAFTAAFRHKFVTVRHPADFGNYTFGIYWDSWGHPEEMGWCGTGIAALGDRWKIRPIGGECAYNWGRWWETLGRKPDDTLRNPRYRNYLIDTIRWLHGTSLGWVADYTGAYGRKRRDPKIEAGAEAVQKALGYRFILDEVRYPARILPGKDFQVTFTVRNVGSAPFYYRWPVELSLLAPETREPVWKAVFRNTDIRRWLPGEQWDRQRHVWSRKARAYTVRGVFHLPPTLQRGRFILTLAILDPAGMLPSCRFAVRNYFHGGRHPIGFIGVDMTPPDVAIDPKTFDDPALDRSLHYLIR